MYETIISVSPTGSVLGVYAVDGVAFPFACVPRSHVPAAPFAPKLQSGEFSDRLRGDEAPSDARVRRKTRERESAGIVFPWDWQLAAGFRS